MSEYSFTVEHHIMAAPKIVYDVWLSPNDYRGPWVGDGERSLDPHVGGKYNWVDRNFSDLGGGGGAWNHWGEFMRIEPGKLIEYSWISQWSDELESKILVQFEADSEDPRFTKVSLTQSGLPDNRHGYEHKNAWIRILGEMGAKFWGNDGPQSRV